MSYSQVPSAIQAFRELQEAYGHLTIREIMSSTDSGTALPVMVSSRAAIQMLTLVDARNFCRIENVAPSSGTTVHIQQFTATAGPGAMSEEVAVSVTDVTIADISISLSIYAIHSQITDLLQRQAAVNFADNVGKAHGNALQKDVNGALYTTLLGNTTNKVTIAGSGEQQIAWSDLLSAKQLVESQRGRPDTLVSAPKKIHELMRKDIASQIFATAYVDYLRTGTVPVIAGLHVFMDPVFKSETWTGAGGEEYAAVLQSDEAVAWAQAWDVSTEIQRYADLVGFRMVTSLAGGSARALEKFIATVEHS